MEDDMTVPVTRTARHRKSYAAKRCSNGAQARWPVALEGRSRQDAAKARNMETLRGGVHRCNELGGLNNRPKSGRKVFEGRLKVAGERAGN